MLGNAFSGFAIGLPTNTETVLDHAASNPRMWQIKVVFPSTFSPRCFRRPVFSNQAEDVTRCNRHCHIASFFFCVNVYLIAFEYLQLDFRCRSLHASGSIVCCLKVPAINPLAQSCAVNLQYFCLGKKCINRSVSSFVFYALQAANRRHQQTPPNHFETRLPFPFHARGKLGRPYSDRPFAFPPVCEPVVNVRRLSNGPSQSDNPPNSQFLSRVEVSSRVLIRISIFLPAQFLLMN